MSGKGKRKLLGCHLVFLFLLGLIAQPALADLIQDGDFSGCKNGKKLRQDNKGQDWYESRKDTEEGRALLVRSTKNIGGNKTIKAMIKAHPELNTYLTQRFPEPQTVFLGVKYDIFVREILPDDNHSGFFFVGGIKDKKGGPNSTRRERFVFLGFENSTVPGKMNLFSREADTDWAGRTVVAENLDLGKWYTISVEANIPEAIYEVTVDGVVEGFELEAHYQKGRILDALTHISFASWNDGAGTFYVDNVQAWSD